MSKLESKRKTVIPRPAFIKLMCEFSHAIVDGEFAILDAEDAKTREQIRQGKAQTLASAATALFTHCFKHVDKKGTVTYGDVPYVFAVPAADHYILDLEIHNGGPIGSFSIVRTWHNFAFDVSVPLEYVPFRRMSAKHPVSTSSLARADCTLGY